MICCWFAKHMIVELTESENIQVGIRMVHKTLCSVNNGQSGTVRPLNYFHMCEESSILDFQRLHTSNKLIYQTMLWAMGNIAKWKMNEWKIKKHSIQFCVRIYLMCFNFTWNHSKPFAILGFITGSKLKWQFMWCYSMLSYFDIN